MKTYIVRRLLKTTCDQVIAIPVRAFDRQEDAHRFATGVQQGMQAMFDCQLVKVQPNGDTYEAGRSLRGYLYDLGLVGFALEVIEMELHGAIELPAPDPIVRLQ